MDAASTETDTEPSESEVEALYDELFGTPALEAEDDEVDRTKAYFLVRTIAEKYPGTARKATRDGTSAHYRNAHPFNYPVSETRASGEVDQ